MGAKRRGRAMIEAHVVGFMRSKAVAAIERGRAGEAFAWTLMLAHAVRKIVKRDWCCVEGCGVGVCECGHATHGGREGVGGCVTPGCECERFELARRCGEVGAAS